jgi:hypothetical protein
LVLWAFTYCNYTAFKDAWANSTRSCCNLLGNEYIKKMLDQNSFALISRCFTYDVLKLEDMVNEISKKYWKLQQILCIDETQVDYC